MRLKFPNPFGYLPADPAAVETLKEKHGFSDAYAAFLRGQNGLSFHTISDAPAVIRARYLVASAEDEDEGRSDLAQLYGVGSGADYSELAHNVDEFIFLPHLFPIGVGYGGNDYVEVLHGPHKGYVGSLDHDMYAGCEDFAGFVDDMEDGLQEDGRPFDSLPPDRQVALLCNPDLGLLWLHAASMDEFVAGIRCVERRADLIHGYVEDAPSVAELDKKD